MIRIKSAVIVLTILSVFSSCGLGGIIYVDANSPSIPGSGTPADPFRKIQDAINAAQNSDTVEIRAGIYTGVGNYNLDAGGKSITICSTDPEDPNIVANTIIDPNSKGRGFYFHSGENANCVVWGLTIQNAYGNFGGGAILCQNSSPTIKACLICNNSTASYGGGVFSLGGSPKVVRCVITGNIADAGGGIECWEGQPTIKSCLIAGNMALGTDGGGGVDCYDSGNARLIGCTVADNLVLDGAGGGLLSMGSNVTIEDSIFWDNDAQQGSQIAVPSWFGITGTATVAYSDAQGGQTAVYKGPLSTLNWGSGNIDSDPCFVGPGYWDDNGTPADKSDDSWVDGDYHLDGSSVCIDAGDPAYTSEANDLDIDGNQRVISDIIDMGADEYIPSTQHTLTISSTSGGWVTTPGEGQFQYDDGDEVEVEAEPEANYHFVSWTGTAVGAGKVEDPNSADTTVTVDGNYTLKANFEIDQRTLTISSTIGGSVTTPGEGVFYYDHGSNVPIVAQAETNYSFASWSGTAVDDGKVAQPDNASTTVTVDADYTLQANFVTAITILYVDDNAPSDPGPNNPAISDPEEDGSADHPFDMIQEAIGVAVDGAVVVVRKGLYFENVNLLGRNITVTNEDLEDPNAVMETVIDGNNTGTVVSFQNGEDANCVLEGFTISGGIAQQGGGIYCYRSSPIISNCSITANKAYYGGGVYCQETNPGLTNCVLSGNLAYNGGGVYNIDNNSTPIISNCTFSGNLASSGGGIYNSSGNLTTINCILWGNSDSGGSDESAQIDVNDGTASVDFCCIQGWTGTLGGTGNFAADPCFAAVGYWDNNGTPADINDDFWVDGDYHLRSKWGRWDPNQGDWVFDAKTSLCIDKGDPNSDWSSELWPNGKRINMGAYGGTIWASMNGSPGDFDINGVVNFEDFCQFARKWRLKGSFIEDLDLDGSVDTEDLGLFAETWLWRK